MVKRFAPPADTLSAVQLAGIKALGESTQRPTGAVPHRLITGPMQADTYTPPIWEAPIR